MIAKRLFSSQNLGRLETMMIDVSNKQPSVRIAVA